MDAVFQYFRIICENKGIGLAKSRKITPTVPKKTIFKKAVRHTDFSARSGCPAPKFYPTKVAAALAMPHAGRIANTISRTIFVVQPAYPVNINNGKQDSMIISRIIGMESIKIALSTLNVV